jgi:beclin 1
VLEKLERTNVYNDAFCIGHDGVFGTINGLRLGRIAGVAVRLLFRLFFSPSPPLIRGQVDWAEINAAWGQTVLLLQTMARRLDFTFEKFVICTRPQHTMLTTTRSWRLVPMGSFSRIERTSGDKASYELHGSGDLALGRLLHNRRFDFGMVAFLDCLRQLAAHVRAQDGAVELPHGIAKDRIGDMSIKLQFNQEENWTRALRHVLLALKILLKWTTSGNA